MIASIWAIVVAGGLVLAAYPMADLQACEKITIYATVTGQQQRAAAGKEPTDARAYCVVSLARPQTGEPAPRPGVQV